MAENLAEIRDNLSEAQRISRRLLSTTDARIWTAEFIRAVRANPDLPLDEGCMIGWFANAIETGRGSS